MDAGGFRELPLMGILRGIDISDVEPLVEAVIGAGLKAMEITMNTPAADRLIAKAVSVSRGRIAIGAGTVLSAGELDKALVSGASFIVLPACVEDVVKRCVDKNIPVFPGALTPQEVLNAWEMGAAMVKVFPSGLFGPAYIKELKGPFDKIRLMAVGGVRLDNVSEYFSSGADAVAFGASVFKKEWLAKKDYASISRLVGEFVSAVKSANA
ncbi:MAG: bifunctional 4-hydroxy-2-oxoglutarate aldolase/2-dehydro-3-deoxy-phosphogluconate aldolase [Candidatus Omnitrophota bacterium]